MKRRPVKCDMCFDGPRLHHLPPGKPGNDGGRCAITVCDLCNTICKRPVAPNGVDSLHKYVWLGPVGGCRHFLTEASSSSGALRDVFEGDFPARIVRYSNINPPLTCDLCETEHVMWYTSTELWGLLPEDLQNKTLCVPCYRLNVHKELSWTPSTSS